MLLFKGKESSCYKLALH